MENIQTKHIKMAQFSLFSLLARWPWSAHMLFGFILEEFRYGSCQALQCLEAYRMPSQPPRFENAPLAEWSDKLPFMTW